MTTSPWKTAAASVAPGTWPQAKSSAPSRRTSASPCLSCSALAQKRRWQWATTASPRSSTSPMRRVATSLAKSIWLFASPASLLSTSPPRPRGRICYARQLLLELGPAATGESSTTHYPTDADWQPRHECYQHSPHHPSPAAAVRIRYGRFTIWAAGAPNTLRRLNGPHGPPLLSLPHRSLRPCTAIHPQLVT